MRNSKPRETKEAIQVIANPLLPTVFVDTVNIAKRADGAYIIRFACADPEGIRVEQAKVAILEDHLRQTIDILSQISGHYPERPPNSDTQSP